MAPLQAISNQPKKVVAVSEESKVRLKLFVDKSSNKVLYAEAGNDFIDFLLHTFTKPLGLAMKEDFSNAVTGGLANLYTSVVEDLSVNYLQCGSETKAAFHNPKVGCSKSFVPKEKWLFPDKAVYKASASNINVNAQIGDGYVKGEVTFMITDDLVVKPLSTSHTVALLNKLRIRDFSKVVESLVVLDSAKGKELLKASLNSKTVLTDTFLAEKGGYFKMPLLDQHSDNMFVRLILRLVSG